jgi:Baseplate J-like protein
MKIDICGCCEGIQKLTPLATANRPGLDALAYRVGTYATFLETMKARLSNLYIDIAREGLDAQGKPRVDRLYPLQKLTTRAGDDPAVALLDCWSILGAVLTFYQERIANEGYLRTATERLSILELARLIGYDLRPGVSASVFLAYTIDTNAKEPVVIPAGAGSQSVPDPGEDAQTFETSDPLEARSMWNNLKPRQTRPQIKATILNGVDNRVYLKGTATNLKQNDPLLIDFGDGNTPQLFRITEVAADTTLDKTLVSLTDWEKPLLAVDGAFKALILKLAHELQDVSALKGTTAKAEMVGRVLDHLKNLELKATTATTDTHVASFLSTETLPHLEEELDVAESDVKYKRVQAWLAPLIDQLQATFLKTVGSGHLSMGADFGVTQVSAKKTDPVTGILDKLTLPTSVPPRNTLYLERKLQTAFSAGADTGTQLISSLQPVLGRTLSTALSHRKITTQGKISVYALRTKAGVFGQSAPKKVLVLDKETGKIITVGEWPIVESVRVIHEKDHVLFLDATYDKILSGSWVVIDMSAVPDPAPEIVQVEPAVRPLVITRALTVQTDIARAEYGISGKTTRLDLSDPWITIIPLKVGPDATAVPDKQAVYDRDFQVLRNATVYTQSEELALAEEPIAEDICNGADPIAEIISNEADNWIELDGWYKDLKSGRSLIVSGERTDITTPDPDNTSKSLQVTGITASEPVMLSEVIQDTSTESGVPNSKQKKDKLPVLPNETAHTFIKLAKKLQYCYRRETVTIYGNVVRATHGESRKEVMGSGDGSQKLQTFTLRQKPLTFVPAPNPQGVDSTLAVYVNDVQWHEVDSLAAQGPTDRTFITRTEDDAVTRVLFGNGDHGARLPTGLENVRASYRNGIGRGGNVKAEQISLLMTRPLGVKEVINPMPASGGADKENRDQARSNAPLAVTALDRLVSVQDYADFTRTFAGIGKAAATRLAVEDRELIHVTIAGADDIPIDKSSDLYLNLLQAIRSYGDPYQPVRIDLRELLILVLSAGVRIRPDYIWDKVATEMRTRLLDAFGFQRRDLGRDVYLSEVISLMQAVPGVAYVDVDLFCAISEKKAVGGRRLLLTPDEITQSITDLLEERQSEQELPDVKKSQPSTRIPVGLASVDDDTIRPARLAIFSPDVPDTLILNQI